MAVTRARHRMESLGVLSAGLGHDMANVLQSMRACLSPLIESGTTPETAPLFDGLRRAIDHLAGLTRGIRSLAMDPDNSSGVTHATDLREWWSTAISPFTWALPKGVQLHSDDFSAAAAMLPPVGVPGHVLMQAVFNIVLNAAQALAKRDASARTGGRGNIWISARLVPASLDPGPRDAVFLTIRDDGPGMDAGTLARCTEAFFTTKPKDHGTGLGLFLVQTTLERHGGKLLVESTVGDGATFTLVLPTAASAVRPAPPPASGA